jgi:hypothetical protein
MLDQKEADMSGEVLRDLVVRMATDPEFAERVRSDPGGVAAEHGLTVEQVAALAQLGDGSGLGGPSMLDARLSKSSLFFGGGDRSSGPACGGRADSGLRRGGPPAAGRVRGHGGRRPARLGGGVTEQDVVERCLLFALQSAMARQV